MFRKIQKEKENGDCERGIGCGSYLQSCCSSPTMLEHNKDHDDDDFEKEIFNPQTKFGGVHVNNHIENDLDAAIVDPRRKKSQQYNLSLDTVRHHDDDDEEGGDRSEKFEAADLTATNNTVSCCTLHACRRGGNDTADERKRSSSNPSMRNHKSERHLEFSQECAQHQPLVKEKSLSSTCTKSVCKTTPADLHVKGTNTRKSVLLIFQFSTDNATMHM